MRYIRIAVNVRHEIISVQEQNAPFIGAGATFEDRNVRYYSVGAVRDEDVTVNSGFAKWLHDRLVFNWASQTAHFKDTTGAIEIFPTETTLAALTETLEKCGRNHALPAEVQQDLKQYLAASDAPPVKLLAALGASADEIKAHPRFAKIRDEKTRAKQVADEAARIAAAEAERVVAQQARIQRRLNPEAANG